MERNGAKGCRWVSIELIPTIVSKSFHVLVPSFRFWKFRIFLQVLIFSNQNNFRTGNRTITQNHFLRSETNQHLLLVRKEGSSSSSWNQNGRDWKERRVGELFEYFFYSKNGLKIDFLWTSSSSLSTSLYFFHASSDDLFDIKDRKREREGREGEKEREETTFRKTERIFFLPDFLHFRNQKELKVEQKLNHSRTSSARTLFSPFFLHFFSLLSSFSFIFSTLSKLTTFLSLNILKLSGEDERLSYIFFLSLSSSFPPSLSLSFSFLFKEENLRYFNLFEGSFLIQKWRQNGFNSRTFQEFFHLKNSWNYFHFFQTFSFVPIILIIIHS